MHLFGLSKQNGYYALHYKCSKEKVHCKNQTAKVIVLNKAVTYLSQKPVNAKHKNDKLSTYSVISIRICRHSSHC